MHLSKSDFEAKITPKIAEAFQAAVDKIGRMEFLATAEIDEQQLQNILNADAEFVSVGLVTLACKINKSHNDPNPNHSSITECLKGTTIRIPSTGKSVPPRAIAKSISRGEFKRLKDGGSSPGKISDQKSFKLLGFSVNTLTFLLLGYFLGGIALSPLIGQQSCIGVTTSPLSLSPCAGSVLGIILGAIAGLGYTYYYFVKKV